LFDLKYFSKKLSCDGIVETVRVSLVHCGAREAIIGDALCGSGNHNVELSVFGAFRNPMLPLP